MDIYLATTLPYSLETLEAFIKSYNAKYWPLHILAIIMASIGIAASYAPGKFGVRIIVALLVSFWIWCGFVFYVLEFSGISFLAPYFAVAFLGQAALLAGTGFIGQGIGPSIVMRSHKYIFPVAMTLLAFFGYPFAVMAYGGEFSFSAYRLAGIEPVATSILTLGFLSVLSIKSWGLKILLMFIPVLHLCVSGFFAYLLIY